MGITPEELARKIDAVRAKEDHPTSSAAGAKTGSSAGAGRAMRAGVDMVAALVVGGFLGYWIDVWLGSKPFGMIIMFFLGAGAGFMNIYRSQMGQDYKIGFKEETKDKE